MTIPPQCAICNQTKAWHEEHRPKHAFTLDKSDLRMAEYTPESIAPQPPTKPSRPLLPSDPVLRKVLIDKGLITVDDIEQAEREIATLSAAFQNFQQTGRRTTVISDPPFTSDLFTLGSEDHDTAEEQVADAGSDEQRGDDKPRKARKKSSTPGGVRNTDARRRRSGTA